jgi:hypothetical protein
MVDNNCIIEGNVKFRDGKKVSRLETLRGQCCIRATATAAAAGAGHC